MSNKVFGVAKVVGIGLTIVGGLIGAFGDFGDMKDEIGKLKDDKDATDESDEEKKLNNKRAHN